MYEIRLATADDMVAIHGLITELAIYEKEPDAVIISPEDLVRHGFDQQRFRCFVGVHSATNTVVGMALFYSRYSTWKGPTIHLEDLYVQPQHRGTGLGKDLFEAVVRVAAEEEAGRMEWTVLEWNEPALKFYQKYEASLDPEWHLGTLSFEQLQDYR